MWAARPPHGLPLATSASSDLNNAPFPCYNTPLIGTQPQGSIDPDPNPWAQQPCGACCLLGRPTEQLPPSAIEIDSRRASSRPASAAAGGGSRLASAACCAGTLRTTGRPTWLPWTCRPPRRPHAPHSASPQQTALGILLEFRWHQNRSEAGPLFSAQERASVAVASRDGRAGAKLLGGGGGPVATWRVGGWWPMVETGAFGAPNA